MSKVNQIAAALLEKEGGAFQRVANAYLHKKGYDRITTIGSAIGSDKTKKGTPDSYIRLENGKIVFAEFTTDQTWPYKKIRGDIEKCLDEKKTGIPREEIEQIVICHNSQLSAEEDRALYTLCLEHGIQLVIFGLNTIAHDLVHLYPGISKNELGIEIDTGQILDPEEFVRQVGKNQLTTPLDTEFYFREDEIKQIVSGLENTNVVMITGPAGVGKSRLALKAMEVFFKTHSVYKMRCIHSKGISIFEDSKVYFSDPGHHLVLIDDANRISDFSIVMDILRNQREDQSIKFVITVRDYAKDKIEREMRTIGDFKRIELAPLEDKQIGEMIQGLFDIRNPDYLERIINVSSGNPRLAIMAAKVAVKHQTVASINDVSALYDEYFSSITEDLKSLKNKEVLKVAGIISFFRSIDKTNKNLMSLISSEFGIGETAFWQAANELHSCEVVDIYEKEVIRISDQVYATYLFYLCFFKECVLDICLLFKDAFLVDRSGRVRDSVYPCFNAFDFDHVAGFVRPLVQTKWQEAIAQADHQRVHGLISLFWFLIKTDVLLYVAREIRSQDLNEVDLMSVEWSPNNINLNGHPLLEILCRFGNLNDPQEELNAVDMAYSYAEVRQEALPHLTHILFENFGFDRRSWKYGYQVEKAIIKRIWDKTDAGNSEIHARVFIALSPKYLRIQHDDNESKKHTLTIYRFNLEDCEVVDEIRSIIWEGLKTLIRVPRYEAAVLNAIQQYSQLGSYLKVHEIVKKDMVHLERIISECLDPENLSHCILVHDCLSLLKGKKLSGVNVFQNFFDSDLFKLFYVLSFDYADSHSQGLEHKAFEEKRKEQLEQYAETIEIDNFQKFIENCQFILKAVRNGRDRNSVQAGIESIIVSFASHNADQSLEIVSIYLKGGNILLIRPWILIRNLVDKHGPGNALSVISGAEYDEKPVWEFGYYSYVPEEFIRLKDCDRLVELYRTSRRHEVPTFFHLLLKFAQIKESIVLDVVDILYDRTQAEEDFGNPFDNLFYVDSSENKAIYKYFLGNEEVLERAYIQHTKVDHNADYDASMLCFLLQTNSGFLNTYFDELVFKSKDYYFAGDTRSYSKLWELSNYEVIVTGLIEYVLQKCGDDIYKSESFLKSIFGAGDRPSGEKRDSIADKQDKLLLSFIETRSNVLNTMRLVFEIISELKAERRFQFIEEFLKRNYEIEEFKRLPVEPSIMSGINGSMVPAYQEILDFWRSLLPFCGTIELLEHKLYVENRIDQARRSLEREKKSDFMGTDW